MMEYKKIRFGNKTIEAILIKLQSKNLIILKGTRGYLMCGYLNLRVAERFKDAGVKIVGVSTLKEALGAKVHSLTSSARKLGIHKGQPAREALKLIA